MRRLPKHLKDLQAAGWPEARYAKAIEDFRAAGITIGYTPMKRSWFSQRIGGRKPGECIVAICWMGFGAFVDMLNAGPEAMFRVAEERIGQSSANN